MQDPSDGLTEHVDRILRALQLHQVNVEQLVNEHFAAHPEDRRSVELSRFVDRIITACGEAERIIHVPAHRVLVKADPGRLAVAVVSLFYVATAGPPIGGLLDVRTTRLGDRAQLSITARIAGARRSRGVSLAQRIAQDHGGDVEVSVADDATRYRLDLPASLAMIPGECLNVLLVDDDMEQVMALAELMRHDGVAIHFATSGAEALAHLAYSATDVVVSDIHLADMTGIDVIRNARRHHPDLRAFLVSGYPSNHPAVENALQEVTAYFSKPVDVDELLQAVVSGRVGDES
jgi:CheY-like chemotaxis protein